jgi:hypothetical protein
MTEATMTKHNQGKAAALKSEIEFYKEINRGSMEARQNVLTWIESGFSDDEIAYKIDEMAAFNDDQRCYNNGTVKGDYHTAVMNTLLDIGKKLEDN